MWAYMKANPGLPTVPIVSGVPRVGEPQEPDKFDRARVSAVERQSTPQPHPGQPPRNEYFCAELAYMTDIERRPLEDEGPFFDLREYLAVNVKGYSRPTDLQVETFKEGKPRSRTVDRWVRTGRCVLHDQRAWPWALMSNGRLPQEWWRDPRFEEALHAWASGREAGPVLPETRGGSV
jgi:hypothetical protein